MVSRGRLRAAGPKQLKAKNYISNTEKICLDGPTNSQHLRISRAWFRDVHGLGPVARKRPHKHSVAIWVLLDRKAILSVKHADLRPAVRRLTPRGSGRGGARGAGGAAVRVAEVRDVHSCRLRSLLIARRKGNVLCLTRRSLISPHCRKASL